MDQVEAKTSTGVIKFLKHVTLKKIVCTLLRWKNILMNTAKMVEK